MKNNNMKVASTTIIPISKYSSVDRPGTGGTMFTFDFINNSTDKGILIHKGNGNPDEEGCIEARIIKVYKLTWWKKLKLKLGFYVKFYEIEIIK